jgi:hypothetical protein
MPLSRQLRKLTSTLAYAVASKVFVLFCWQPMNLRRPATSTSGYVGFMITAQDLNQLAVISPVASAGQFEMLSCNAVSKINLCHRETAQ